MFLHSASILFECEKKIHFLRYFILRYDVGFIFEENKKEIAKEDCISYSTFPRCIDSYFQ